MQNKFGPKSKDIFSPLRCLDLVDWQPNSVLGKEQTKLDLKQPELKPKTSIWFRFRFNRKPKIDIWFRFWQGQKPKLRKWSSVLAKPEPNFGQNLLFCLLFNHGPLLLALDQAHVPSPLSFIKSREWHSSIRFYIVTGQPNPTSIQLRLV